jgi:hypothetical protein
MTDVVYYQWRNTFKTWLRLHYKNGKLFQVFLIGNSFPLSEWWKADLERGNACAMRYF